MKKLLAAFVLIASAFSLLGCGGAKDSEKEEYFAIQSTSAFFYIDKQNIATNLVSFSIDQKNSSLLTSNFSDVIYYVSGLNDVGASIEKNVFSASQIGEVTIGAKIGDLESSNTIAIVVDYSDDYKTKQESSIAKAFKSLEDTVLVLGSAYSIGITEATMSHYTLLGADGILEFGSDGKIEVCGIAYGKMSLHSDISNSDIAKDVNYNVNGGSIFAATIKEHLINEGIIQDASDPVKKAMLGQIKVLDLSTVIVNDPNCIYGIKYLTNIEELDLSDNGINNISFAASITHLSKLDISHNNISDITSVINHSGLTYLDISDNNVSDITKIQHLHNLTYLNLSDNKISDITYVGSLYELRTLILNNNKLTMFSDSLAGLQKLIEFGIGNCGINFTNIISLTFVKRLTYLDISGTDCSLSTISQYGNLKTLILANCNLFEKDLSSLNSLTNLAYLDISNNALNVSEFKDKLQASSLKSLKTLCLGANEFSEVPDLSSFVDLEVLDLTDSYNLQSLTCLGNLNISELILDGCNSIQVDDDGTAYLAAIGKDKLPNLQRLSIVSGLNYMTKDMFDHLMDLVGAGLIKLRFLDEKYVDASTIYDYASSVFFSMADFISSSTLCPDGNYTTPSLTSKIILSLVNDRSANAKADYRFVVPKSVFCLDVYGNEYDTYNISIIVADRKQSSFTISMINFHDAVTSANPLIETADGARLKIVFGSNCFLSSQSPQAAIVGYDVMVFPKNSSSALSLRAAKGKDGANNEKGLNGACSLYCNSASVRGAVTLTAGDGGKGGFGTSDGWATGTGKDGGNGGHCISFRTNFFVESSVVFNPGKGGSGGEGQTGAFWTAGTKGNNGVNGQSTYQRMD